ncbi:hypothetical protein BDW66DRAFT_26648 [Aspergillus desertorum]
MGGETQSHRSRTPPLRLRPSPSVSTSSSLNAQARSTSSRILRLTLPVHPRLRREPNRAPQNRSPRTRRIARRIARSRARGRRRRRAILQAFHTLRPPFTGQTAPNRLDGVGAPVGTVAWEGASAGGVERYDGGSADAGLPPHPDALELT